MSEAAGLTRKQMECKAFIATYTAMHGVSPSYDEIADNLGYASKSQTHRIVECLVERGHASILPNKRRSIQIVENICPTCGHKAAP